MVTEQDQIKVLDFGLATLAAGGPINATDETGARAAAVETGAGTILGTVAYMSPEQAEGHAVDARSDIFSFGAIFYEMLSGLRAFRGGTTFGTLAAVINLEPEPLAKVATHVPAEVDELVSACLRKDVSRRAQSTSDLKVELDGLREASSSGSLRVAAPKRLGRWGRYAAVGGIIVAGAAAARDAVAGAAAADGVHDRRRSPPCQAPRASPPSRPTAARSRSRGSAKAAPAPTSTRRRSGRARRCG